MSNQLQQISAEDVIGWEPCDEYTPERIRELLPEPVPVLALCDMRRFRSVPVGDRLWVLQRPEILDDRDLRLFRCDWAERALMRERRAGREPDERSWDAVAVSRRYAAGDTTMKELDDAREAARNATWAAWASLYAAGDAAWDAAWNAAEAAWDATEAARDAGNAEESWQLKRVAHYLRGQR